VGSHFPLLANQQKGGQYMTLRDFLELHKDGETQGCVTIRQEPYDWGNNKFAKTYFEEEGQEYILQSDTFKAIANKQVDHFNIMGGGAYKVELCIYLEED
jgi:hypothetical protein